TIKATSRWRMQMKSHKRWKEYFDGLLKEESPRDHQDNGTTYTGLTRGIERESSIHESSY
ncbi:hypothetical protein, partial [Nocardioides malaquae]|uniref:hypothetical protein n=1 Tax=Nocardioides malaquae TaxID=2773426 RepID=UPI001D0D485E